MDYIINIECDTHGNFTYYPSSLRVAAADTVQWKCMTAPFVIMLKDQSPFVEGMEAWAVPSVPSLAMTVADTRGQFHYAVAVYHGGRVWIDAGCPVLVVN